MLSRLQLDLGDVTRVIDVSSGQLGINAAISNGTGGITKSGAGILRSLTPIRSRARSRSTAER